MPHYLVTGGAGFIGSHLVDALVARGDTVTVLDDLSSGKAVNVAQRATLIEGDIRDEGTISRAIDGAAGCFHLAAIASVPQCNNAWHESHSVNAGGTIRVFEAAMRLGIPVAYASSAAVYGEPARVPVSEADPPRPLTAYGADKLSNELHARSGGLVHGLRSTGLRFFNVYGPRQDPSSPYSGVISIFANRLLRGEPITIFGDGGQSRDFIYVGDVVRHLLQAIEIAAADAPVFNVCTGAASSINALAETLATALSVSPDIAHGAGRAGDIRHSVGDPSKARQALGLAAQVSLSDGLAATLKGI